MKKLFSKKLNKNIHIHEKQHCKKMLLHEGIDQEKNQLNNVDAFIADRSHVCTEKDLKDQPELIPLVFAKEGNHLLIKDFSGGIKSKMRLVNMGVRIGDYVDVITNYGNGQMLIALGHMRLILCRGLAQKILVERISS